jgi:hypothetical protein
LFGPGLWTALYSRFSRGMLFVKFRQTANGKASK